MVGLVKSLFLFLGAGQSLLHKFIYIYIYPVLLTLISLADWLQNTVLCSRERKNRVIIENESFFREGVKVEKK